MMTGISNEITSYRKRDFLEIFSKEEPSYYNNYHNTINNDINNMVSDIMNEKDLAD